MNKVKPVVYKSNYIVEASYKLTLGEQRVIHVLTSMINKDDEEFKVYKLTIKEFVEILGAKNKNVYTEVARYIESLRERDLKIIKENSTLRTKWLSSAEYFHNEGYVELCFDPKLKPYLLLLKGRFTQIPLSHLMNFKRQYTSRLYELLKQYEKFGERKITLEDLRTYLGIDFEQYPLYGNFKQKVLLTAEKEINNGTDLQISFEEIKVARKVSELKFTIKSRNIPQVKLTDSKPQKHEKEAKKEPSETIFGEIKSMLDDKVTHTEAKKLYDASNKDLEKILKVYNYSKGKEIDNLVGYMLGILKNGFNEPQKNVPKKKKDFTEREYDYDKLERKLLGWD